MLSLSKKVVFLVAGTLESVQSLQAAVEERPEKRARLEPASRPVKLCVTPDVQVKDGANGYLHALSIAESNHALLSDGEYVAKFCNHGLQNWSKDVYNVAAFLKVLKAVEADEFEAGNHLALPTAVYAGSVNPFHQPIQKEIGFPLLQSNLPLVDVHEFSMDPSLVWDWRFPIVFSKRGENDLLAETLKEVSGQLTRDGDEFRFDGDPCHADDDGDMCVTVDGKLYYLDLPVDEQPSSYPAHVTARRNTNLGEMSIAPDTIFSNLVNAILYLHNRGVIHNDISLENTLISGGKAYLMDWDTATFQSDHGQFLSAGDSPEDVVNKLKKNGNPEYMAPECFHNIHATLDQAHELYTKWDAFFTKRDVFSLAVVMFRLFTRDSFEYERSAEEQVKVAAVPEKYHDLLTAMLTQDPLLRPTIADVKVTLDGVEA